MPVPKKVDCGAWSRFALLERDLARWAFENNVDMCNERHMEDVIAHSTSEHKDLLEQQEKQDAGRTWQIIELVWEYEYHKPWVERLVAEAMSRTEATYGEFGTWLDKLLGSMG